MASFARLALPQRVWTIEEYALFAARKEFELLKLLSTDRKALATARRLGYNTSAWQPHPHNAVASTAADPAALSTGGANDSSTPSHATIAPRRVAPRARRPRHQPQPHVRTHSKSQPLLLLLLGATSISERDVQESVLEAMGEGAGFITTNNNGRDSGGGPYTCTRTRI